MSCRPCGPASDQPPRGRTHSTQAPDQASPLLRSSLPFPPAKQGIKMIDIGINLCDQQYRGMNRGRQQRPGDLPVMLQRGWDAGVDRAYATAGSLRDLLTSLRICVDEPRLMTTAGVHPSSSKDAVAARPDMRSGKPETYEGLFPGHYDVSLLAPYARIEQESGHARMNNYFRALDALLAADQEQMAHSLANGLPAHRKIIAVGECGLDYDRLRHTTKNIQKDVFMRHFDLSEKYRLPMFLHSRNSCDDFLSIMKQNLHRVPGGGVVHSFTGSWEEAKQLIELGLFLGVNGCSLKTEDNLQTVRRIPLELLLLETDGPWCMIRRSHAGYHLIRSHYPQTRPESATHPLSVVRDRVELVHMNPVLEVVTAIRHPDGPEAYQLLSDEEKDAAERALAHQVFLNTLRLFHPEEYATHASAQ
ncbi:hypothetical protein H696_02221 [Fonticula alba]|uniref:TatD DNase n=1 Tax=Fonticula alba TaxID=691883 RepID=A0A058ZAB8_FONAL|nr:hypothetical protein H696_02221 [Fonticula alba]KCV71274.1 hypothetical protein H696_02221 [Fonticula alba]|eukprot:XP_009494397.1 hypothetical protein H696_02221 [Fonticula alba]